MLIPDKGDSLQESKDKPCQGTLNVVLNEDRLGGVLGHALNCDTFITDGFSLMRDRASAMPRLCQVLTSRLFGNWSFIPTRGADRRCRSDRARQRKGSRAGARYAPNPSARSRGRAPRPPR